MSEDFLKRVMAEFGFPAVFALVLLFIVNRYVSQVSAAKVQLMKRLGSAIEVIQRELAEIRVTQSLIATKIIEDTRRKPPKPDQPSQTDQNGP